MPFDGIGDAREACGDGHDGLVTGVEIVLALLTAVAGALPAAIAYLAKLILDAVVAEIPAFRATGTADYEHVLPSGLGSRHAAAMAVSVATQCISIVVSSSTGQVTLFRRGVMLPLTDNKRTGGA